MPNKGSKNVTLVTQVLKKKRKLAVVCYDLHNTSNKENSRRGRTVTAKKCSKTCAASAELLFC